MGGFRLPGLVELSGYCSVTNMTPALVEQLVVETERAIGEPIRHTIRNLFPKPLDRSIQEEVTLGWKAPKRVLTLSNTASSPNHVRIHAERHPRPKGGAYPADWGEFRVLIKASAPQALEVLTNVSRYAELSHAFFVRADSPCWWDSYDRAKAAGVEHEVLRPKGFRIASEERWAISERIGWINYFGPRASKELNLLSTSEDIGAEQMGQGPHGGYVVKVTATPFDFSDAHHWKRYGALLSFLAPHRHDGTPIRPPAT